jgi:hypothetical protein
VLTPLGVEYNQADLRAWSSSVDHIHATAGFEGYLARRAHDARAQPRGPASSRRGLRPGGAASPNSVLSDPGCDVVGCVYIYPSPLHGVDAVVRSWVRASRAELDERLYRTVSEWLAVEWPFRRFDYAPR